MHPKKNPLISCLRPELSITVIAPQGIPSWTMDNALSSGEHPDPGVNTAAVLSALSSVHFQCPLLDVGVQCIIQLHTDYRRYFYYNPGLFTDAFTNPTSKAS